MSITREASCPNCRADLRGEWCHECGQRRIRPEHRRFHWLFAQLVSGIASLDSKLLRSVLTLFVRPGKLGAEWLAGRRVRWVSPVGLFLVVNLVYFIAPPLSDFNLPLGDHLASPVYSEYTQRMAESKMPGINAWFSGGDVAEPARSFEEFVRRFEAQSGSWSKTLLIVHVPPTALALWVLYLRRKVLYVDHFAIALNYWSFILLIMMIVPRASDWIGRAMVQTGVARELQSTLAVWKVGLLALAVGHLVLALRRAYGDRLWQAVLRALPTFVACLAAHVIYRPILFTLTLWTI